MTKMMKINGETNTIHESSDSYICNHIQTIGLHTYSGLTKYGFSALLVLTNATKYFGIILVLIMGKYHRI